MTQQISHRQIGQEAILIEAKGLQLLANSLGENFNHAVDLIRSHSGRLVVSGIGKSGHVGRKIVATFASTGQPALFVHAAEAGHGDLGMIAKGDVLLLISYSGEAKELGSIIDYAHRFAIPIISITGRENCMLARVSTIALVLPDAPEACPMQLAPTTSTTLTMALGDALAVALLRDRGFSKHDFKIFHPGGSLGQQLKRVSDLMHSGEKLPLANPQTLMSDILVEMTVYGFGCVAVVNESGHLLGIITDGDLRRHMNPQLLEQRADEIMTRQPVTLSPDALMADALAMMESRSITNVFVVDDQNKVAGIIHIHDCLRHSVA